MGMALSTEEGSRAWRGESEPKQGKGGILEKGNTWQSVGQVWGEEGIH